MSRQSPRAARKFFSGRFPAKARNGQEGAKLSFSTPVLCGVGVALLCAIGWAFFMGFMVGRGQNPEARLREMAGIEREAAPMQRPEENPPAEMEKETPEDREITGDTATDRENTAKEPIANATAMKPEMPFRRPQGAEADAWEKPAATQARQPEPAKKEAQNIFEYTFQAAAFKSQGDAANLKKKLDSAKIRSQTRKSGKVYLLIVNFRGTEKGSMELRQKLESFKLGKALLLNKKQISGKKQKGR